MYADPLRKHDCAPVTDGAAAIVLAAGDRARDAVERPAWITGFAHRVDAAPARRPRPDPLALGGAARREPAGVDGVEVAELHAPFCHQELILRRELGLGDDVRDQPVGRRAGRQPDVHQRA